MHVCIVHMLPFLFPSYCPHSSARRSRTPPHRLLYRRLPVRISRCIQKSKRAIRPAPPSSTMSQGHGATTPGSAALATSSYSRPPTPDRGLHQTAINILISVGTTGSLHVATLLPLVSSRPRWRPTRLRRRHGSCTKGFAAPAKGKDSRKENSRDRTEAEIPASHNTAK